MFILPETYKTRNTQRGFSLFELLIALAIVAAMAAVAGVMFLSAPGPAQARADARAMAATMRAIRADAIATRSSLDFEMDLQSYVFIAGEREGAVRRSFSLTGVGAASLSDDKDVIGVRFYPNGASSGGRFDIRTGALVVTVTADWMTGKISISETVDAI